MQTLGRSHRSPAEPLPAHTADCHMHVFGPYDRFPLAAERAYNVPEAPLGAHERMKAAVGLERTVLVQASGHGTDNRAMLAALAELGPRGRGVAVVAPQTPLVELQRMHKAGVRGARLNLYTFAVRHPGEPAALFRTYERLVAPLGWHVQLFCEPATLLALASAIEHASVQVVIDHMGLPDAAQGIAQPAFQCLLSLTGGGHAWRSSPVPIALRARARICATRCLSCAPSLRRRRSGSCGAPIGRTSASTRASRYATSVRSRIASSMRASCSTFSPKRCRTPRRGARSSSVTPKRSTPFQPRRSLDRGIARGRSRYRTDRPSARYAPICASRSRPRAPLQPHVQARARRRCPARRSRDAPASSGARSRAAVRSSPWPGCRRAWRADKSRLRRRQARSPFYPNAGPR